MAKATCKEDDCVKLVSAKGLCKRHYERQRIANYSYPQCRLPNCLKSTRNGAGGLCCAHYHRGVRKGDPEAEVRPYGAKHYMTCSEGDCDLPVRSVGLCMTHGNAFYKAQTAAAGPCKEPDCYRPRAKRGWCIAHYQRNKAHGSPNGGGPARRDRGSGFPHDWYTEQRRRKIGWPSRETLDYIEIIRRDPCVYCGAPMEHVDHIRAVARDGKGDWSNLAPTCAHCNQVKQTRDVLHFMLARLDQIGAYEVAA